MNTIILTCPECHLDLDIATVEAKEGARDGVVGGHVHMAVTGTVLCLNGHEWTASGDFLLTRSR
jgi:hypothetical protein